MYCIATLLRHRAPTVGAHPNDVRGRRISTALVSCFSLTADEGECRLSTVGQYDAVYTLPRTGGGHALPTLHTFLRFSTPEQALGDSEWRQIEDMRKWAAAQRLRVQRRLRAPGGQRLSAFRRAGWSKSTRSLRPTFCEKLNAAVRRTYTPNPLPSRRI